MWSARNSLRVQTQIKSKGVEGDIHADVDRRRAGGGVSMSGRANSPARNITRAATPPP